jgi:hypothetical protein
MYIILFIIGISLVILNWRAIKKEKSSFKSTFQLAASDLKESDIKIGEIRREFAETITELQREIIDLRELVKNLQNSEQDFHNHHTNNHRTEIIDSLKHSVKNEIQEFYNNNAENDEISYNKHIIEEDERNKESQSNENSIAVDKFENENSNIDENTVQPTNNLKIEDVRNLFNKGLTIEEIATELNIGKGEVLLIKELYLR